MILMIPSSRDPGSFCSLITDPIVKNHKRSTALQPFSLVNSSWIYSHLICL